MVLTRGLEIQLSHFEEGEIPMEQHVRLTKILELYQKIKALAPELLERFEIAKERWIW